jgi:hypothetical protein
VQCCFVFAFVFVFRFLSSKKFFLISSMRKDNSLEGVRKGWRGGGREQEKGRDIINFR